MEKRKSQEVTRERAAWEKVMETGNGVDAKQIESLAMPTCVPMLHSGKKNRKRVAGCISYRDLLHDRFKGILIWRNCTGSGN